MREQLVTKKQARPVLIKKPPSRAAAVREGLDPPHDAARQAGPDDFTSAAVAQKGTQKCMTCAYTSSNASFLPIVPILGRHYARRGVKIGTHRTAGDKSIRAYCVLAPLPG